jgi:hypothetical protein
MPAPKQHRLGADGRRVLTMLAGSPDGATERWLTANGVSSGLLVELVAAGLVTTTSEHVRRGGRQVMPTRVKITGAGWRALGI